MILDLGVLLYILLSGHNPFQDDSLSKILTGKYEEMQGGCWDGDKQGSRAEAVSEGAKVGQSYRKEMDYELVNAGIGEKTARCRSPEEIEC